MRIRDLSPDEMYEIGRRLYEARKVPMVWNAAIDAALGDSPVAGASNAALSLLARDYALRSGNPWPAVKGHWMTYPGAMERVAKGRAERKARKGAAYKRRREALGLTPADIVALFPGCPIAEIERIEREGPDDYLDHRAMCQALDHLEREASAPPIRDWLILTDGPARFASELPAPA